MSNDSSIKTLEIHNSDLAWDGTPLGLQPRIANPETARLVDAPPTIDHELVHCCSIRIGLRSRTCS